MSGVLAELAYYGELDDNPPLVHGHICSDTLSAGWLY